MSSNWRYYSHDARGNVTADGNHSFGYDFANQPTSVSGTNSGSYTYDGNLKRAKQVVDGETIYSVYDRVGGLVTRENVSNSKLTDYLSVAGQTFARIRNGTPSYPLNDHLGTALAEADQSGSVLAASVYNYTPFGETVGSGPGTNNEQGYTGHVEDATGLTYMQARYYDPVIGRFLQTDPIGYEDQLNLYAYVANDPVNAIDPTGMFGSYPGFTPEHGKMAEPVQAVLAFAPIAGDLMGIGDAVVDPTLINVAAAVVGLIPAVGNPAAASMKTGKAVLSNSDNVVRGGTNTAERFTNGSGVTTNADGTLNGVSVNSAPGASVEQLSQGIPNVRWERLLWEILEQLEEMLSRLRGQTILITAPCVELRRKKRKSYLLLQFQIQIEGESC